MKFVKLAKYGFVLEPRYYFYGWSPSPDILARPALAQALVQARTYLPKGYNFKIWDCQRDRPIQLKMIAAFKRIFMVRNPKLKGAALDKAVNGFAAKPLRIVTSLDTHRNGGAVDVTIVDQRGRELWMGTDHDNLTEMAATDYFETKKNLSLMDREALKNRRLLKKVLLKANFDNIAWEWWHWSYDELKHGK
jgi:D-alanyl-D-alanine dipeptidase